ncbi:unnamed protein product [Colletotrichum noveboracense]|uniref:CorA-like Mg2+ transporter n=1 Tax=Colletotrichum noveboracense TaxID=2664923 RepID=A0A9W4RYJ8_9PEZI|nr:unnamed protein product [Colletotrichum noveboracense]
MSRRLQKVELANIVCRGHMKWLFKRASASGEPFCPHYWVDGTKIKGWKRNEYLPGKSLVDTPFQLIKAGDFSKSLNEEILHRSSLENIAKKWIETLKKLDKRGSYTFPRFDTAPTRTFYLTDHVLIWQAIKSSERLGLNLPMTKDYSSECVQKNILKRFTTENPLSKKRMLAVRRTPTYTRFLLRSKDSALFRAMEQGLFANPGKKNSSKDPQNVDVWKDQIDTWKNVIDCQMYHENNDDTTWDDPLRFALAIIVNQYLKKSMNLRPRQEMFEQAISALLGGCSANGIFPGKTDTHHEPTMYDSELARDQYWGKTFEIPYILWNYCSDLNDELETGDESTTSSLKEANKTFNDHRSQLQITSQAHTTIKEPSDQDMRVRKVAYAVKHPMKRSFPFNDMVDEKNIVDLQDEWLYHLPPFFVPKSQCEDESEQVDKDRASISGNHNTEDSGVEQKASMEKASNDERQAWFKIDYRKSKSLKDSNFVDSASMEAISTEADIHRIIARGRTLENAKKRWWMFQSPHPSENRLCLLTISKGEKREKYALEALFNRHQSSENFFLDQTMAELNMWHTELHLSFHTCYSSEEEDGREIEGWSDQNDIIFPSLIEGEKPFRLKKITMSFRFEGDFFDRYWTCRQLNADPEGRLAKDLNAGAAEDEGNESRSDDGSDADDDDDGYNEVKIHEWDRVLVNMKQRKVMEIALSNTALMSMNSRAEEILKKVNETLENGKDTLRKSFEASQRGSKSTGNDEIELLDYKGFLIASKRFQEFQTCLRRFEGHITESLATVDLWLNRQKMREAERPRWSANDESRYRSFILKGKSLNDQSAQSLKIYHNKVSHIIETTTKDLELMRSYLDIMRNDLDLRRSEDIKRFTYVTVVFLPLGFATGIFSTSGSPAGPTLVNMILTAISTLAITLLGLAGYKFIDSPRSRKELSERW